MRNQSEIDVDLSLEVLEEDLVEVAIEVAWPELDNPEDVSDEDKDIDTFGPDRDLITVYLAEAGRYPLLKPAEENT